MQGRRLTLMLVLVPIAVAAWSGAAAAGHKAGDPTNVHDLPLGDGRTTTAGPKRGDVFECRVAARAGGADHAGSWIHDDGTFDLTAKAVVDGAVHWPGKVSFTVRGSKLVVRGNGLPVTSTTGIFPISPSDDAYQYDRNPNSIQTQTVTWTLPAKPRIAKHASCLSGGPIGIAANGVAIFDALDAANRDAVAHEAQDSCEGHPQNGGIYHYHSIPTCLTKGNESGLVGYALDGFPIYGPRENGKLLTDADLDACHGHVSWVTLRGKRVRIYHYNATLEYPYTLGCYRGTPVRTATAGGGGRRHPGPPGLPLGPPGP